MCRNAGAEAEKETELLSPSVLAFVGDAVYGLYVREALAAVNRPSGELHRLSARVVNAAAQAEAFGLIEPLLTERELAVFRRGRNFHTSTTPKNATGGQYHAATGLEALFGYLHLSGQDDRARSLFSVIRQAQENVEPGAGKTETAAETASVHQL